MIPARFLTECYENLSPIFAIIFTQSLQTGTLPANRKEPSVFAIFKKWKRYNPANCRPVSLDCACCEMLERIIVSNVLKHVDGYEILSDCQHDSELEWVVRPSLLLYSMTWPTHWIVWRNPNRNGGPRLFYNLWSRRFWNFATTVSETILINGYHLFAWPFTTRVSGRLLVWQWTSGQWGSTRLGSGIHALAAVHKRRTRLIADDWIVYRLIKPQETEQFFNRTYIPLPNRKLWGA